MDSYYHKKLLDKLGDLTEYEYMGSYTNKFNDKKNNYMIKMEESGIEYPPLSGVCECTHWIKQNCYIRNIKTNKILIVGDCCIKHFKIKKKCSNCKCEHRRTKFNICVDCEKKEKKDIDKFNKYINSLRHKKIEFGQYKGESLGDIFKKDSSYVNWCFRKYEETNDKIFGQFLDYFNSWYAYERDGLI